MSFRSIAALQALRLEGFRSRDEGRGEPSLTDRLARRIGYHVSTPSSHHSLAFSHAGRRRMKSMMLHDDRPRLSDDLRCRVLF